MAAATIAMTISHSMFVSNVTIPRYPLSIRDKTTPFAAGFNSRGTRKKAAIRPRGVTHMAAPARQAGAGIGIGGILVIAGILIWIFWSFWVGLIVALIGLVAFGGFVRGRWY